MKRTLLSILTLALGSGAVYPQAGSAPSPQPRTQPAQVQRRLPTSFDLSEYGVSLQAEPRLIIMMAALEAAGFDPTPPGRETSVFRAQVRKDLLGVDPDLRSRMHNFFDRNKLPAPSTAADQAARYLSLALVLGPPPSLDAPERSEDLPGGILEVLDFAPLVREFYRRSGIDERLVTYTRAYQAEGDRLRPPTAEMVRAVLSYLHTRPITVAIERVVTKAPAAGKKKSASRAYTTREHERRFLIVPDLLAAPGAINLRVIGEEYYAIVPEGTDPTSSELRRGYLQYVIDPLMLRYNRQIAAHREEIRQLLAEREKAGANVTPDVFLAVSRSLVAAANARFDQLIRLHTLSAQTRVSLDKAKDEASRSSIAKQAQEALKSIEDETAAELAEEYERGAVLTFFFSDQLRWIESSGFDIANFFEDMISAIDTARESRRPAEYAAARTRALAARQARLAQRNQPEVTAFTAAESAKVAALIKKLAEIEGVLRLKDYQEAEIRLRALLQEYPGESRVFFALAKTASLAASDATDEEVQAQRLNKALTNYRLAVAAASPETDRALLSRAHEAMGRIHAFLEHRAEAATEFDEAIKIQDVPGGAYSEALEGKKKLSPPK